MFVCLWMLPWLQGVLEELCVLALQCPALVMDRLVQTALHNKGQTDLITQVS